MLLRTTSSAERNSARPGSRSRSPGGHPLRLAPVFVALSIVTKTRFISSFQPERGAAYRGSNTRQEGQSYALHSGNLFCLRDRHACGVSEAWNRLRGGRYCGETRQAQTRTRETQTFASSSQPQPWGYPSSGRKRRLLKSSRLILGLGFENCLADQGNREAHVMAIRGSGTHGKDRSRSTFLAISVACTILVTPTRAAECQRVNFDTWLEGFKQQAAAEGISQRTIAAALNGVIADASVISHDRSQMVLQQSFEQFSSRMISSDRLRKGANMLKRYGSVLERIEARFGVPAPVLIAIWGLETDFGVNQGRFSTIRSLATLAYDCRRPETFRAELLEALRIIDRGDLTPTEMRGAWAGEIGQTQLLPSSYVKFAVDVDGNGHRDLIHSTPNALASAANYLKAYGWQRDQAWTSGSANFDVLKKWNASEVYTKTIAYFATQLAQEP
jgi:lytic murein transglycosylase